MPSGKNDNNTLTTKVSIWESTDQMLRVELTGDKEEAKKLRRSLMTRIRRELDANPKDCRLWCLLGDLYTTKARKIECYKEALGADERDPEANAELARLLAPSGDKKFGECFDQALEHCQDFDIEDSVIYSALEAAKAAGDEARQRKALQMGRQRFPKSVLFR